MRKVNVLELVAVTEVIDQKLTNKLLRQVKHESATFHQFGVDYEEFDNGFSQFTTAIVELADGSIITPPASLIQFLPDEKTNVKRRFKDLPLGTRFKYDSVANDRVFVILDHFIDRGRGTVAVWNGVYANAVMQEVFCFADSREECETTEVIAIE